MDVDEDELEMSKILEEKSTQENERKAIRRRIKHVDRRMLELQAAYAAICNNKSSVLRLPKELTRIIFLYYQYCPRGNGSLSEDPWTSPWSGPFPEIAISHVCRQWRSRSLADPILWTKFFYDASLSPRVPLDQFEAYLQRSKTKPLEFWFKFKDFDHAVIDCEDHWNLLEKAIGHVERWKRISVIADTQTPLLSAPCMLEWACAPSLEYFAFCTNNYNLESEFPSSLKHPIFKNGAPKLESVILDSSVGQELMPPLRNITTLCLECPKTSLPWVLVFGWPAFVEVLSIPSLINLSVLGLVVDSPPQLESIGIIAMDYLQNLRLCKSGPFSRLHTAILQGPIAQNTSHQAYLTT